MKKLTLLTLLFPALALPSGASISIDTFAGEFLDASGSNASDSSLWAIIYDSNGDDLLPGGLTPDSSLLGTNASQAFTDFSGQQILTGQNIGFDKILWAGEIDGANLSGTPSLGYTSLSNFTFAELGVVANGKWAVYWFPELTIDSDTLGLSPFEVGGLQQTSAGASLGDLGMVMPATDDTGTNYTAAFINSGDNGGDIAPATFTAVVVPEPTTLSLSALALVTLLRRRRY
ncbi:MAG: PEP-CTERM sorting domain-containing protein [Akkermansiaceae bacterium]|nr:PEP-CTERM sorting domain-containing protein [Akkermansiaceae bacterium]MCF7732734.1 PEP-CTERM sorting domain-containing protein [Akkermansiaceae bacterium]